MASSSKNINMPLVFAVAVGSIFALIASVVFGLAWYEYEQRVALREQVLSEPTHTAEFDAVIQQQTGDLHRTDQTQIPRDGMAPLTIQHQPIEQAMQRVVADQAAE